MNGRAIANETLRQLGGAARLSAMIGAENFTNDKHGSLTFHFKLCRKANVCKIVLDPSDTYNVEFYRYNAKRLECPLVERFDSVYNDSLREVFERYTGLYIRL